MRDAIVTVYLAVLTSMRRMSGRTRTRVTTRSRSTARDEMSPDANLGSPTMRQRLAPDALAFAVLRGLTMIGGFAALSIVPLRPEHQVHLIPLLGVFIVYKAALFALLFLRPGHARGIFLATLGADLGIVFVLVWFTGGGESHFYLLFSLLVALNAYHFGYKVGVLAAAGSAGLMIVANVLVTPPAPWAHIGARAMLFGLLGLALGHIADRERAARADAEAVNGELRAALADVREAQHRALRAERLAAAGQISARMAHEVRSPISAIGLNVELLEEILAQCPEPTGGEAGDLVRGIRAEVKRLADLTDEYLTFGRLPQARPEEDSVDDMIEEMVGFVRPAAERRGVALKAEVDPPLPLLPFDRDLVRRAVLNLVRNALDATPREGQVSVAARREGDRIAIAVSDSGRGIAAQDAPRLFDPFFTTKPRGTGLGLVIARQIAEEHGGTLTWENVPDGGARFTLRLPLDGCRR
jgi:signal transduction histidine kinase